MENKDSYTPKEAADMVGAYAQLDALDKEIGGGRRIAMPEIDKFGEGVKEIAEVIPSNVAELLKKKPSELEQSILATVERSRD